jgi:hypothetical protein
VHRRSLGSVVIAGRQRFVRLFSVRMARHGIVVLVMGNRRDGGVFVQVPGVGM